jgi:hypothetical protein
LKEAIRDIDRELEQVEVIRKQIDEYRTAVSLEMAKSAEGRDKICRTVGRAERMESRKKSAEGLGTTEESTDMKDSVAAFRTKVHRLQAPHYDFSLEELRDEAKTKNMFITFMPLTKAGCVLQVWTYELHRPDDDEKCAELLYIPYGFLLILPAATMHAGCFMSDADSGNLRLQFTIYLNGLAPPDRQGYSNGDEKDEAFGEGRFLHNECLVEPPTPEGPWCGKYVFVQEEKNMVAPTRLGKRKRTSSAGRTSTSTRSRKDSSNKLLRRRRQTTKHKRRSTATRVRS